MESHVKKYYGIPVAPVYNIRVFDKLSITQSKSLRTAATGTDIVRDQKLNYRYTTDATDICHLFERYVRL